MTEKCDQPARAQNGAYMTASRARAHFTPERLRALFDYDQVTGALKRRSDGATHWRKNSHGYPWVWVGGAALLVHRIAWRITTGEWPAMVDHINGDRADSRWSNLRETDHSLNAQNYTKAMRTNKSGLLGVSRDKRCKTNQFRAAIRIRGLHIALGYYPTPEQAHEAYLRAKAVYHPTAAIASENLTPFPAHPITTPHATAAKSASCCAGAKSAAASGSAIGSKASPRREAKTQPMRSALTPPANGRQATVAALATGDELMPCRSTCPAFDCAGCAFPFSRPTPEVTA